jgi:hypothetical protein
MDEVDVLQHGCSWKLEKESSGILKLMENNHW